MAKKTRHGSWRLEVNNPRESTGWRLLWSFKGDQYTAYQELTEKLNVINAPVQLRIASDND